MLDPDKLGSLTKRHARYSSMSPRFAAWSFNAGHKGYQPKLSDLDVNDAIHSFGAVDTDDDEDEEEQETKRHHQKFFSQRHNHQHTHSTLTIDMNKTHKVAATKRVPTFKVDINPLYPSTSVDSNHNHKHVNGMNSNTKINLNGNELLSKDMSGATSTPPFNAGNYGKVSPFSTKPSPDMLQKEESISEMSNLPNAQKQDNDEFLEDDFIPPPSYTKRESLKTIDIIRAEKKAKRMSERRNSPFLSSVNAKMNKGKIKNGKKKPKEFDIPPISNMKPIDQYMRDRRDQKRNGTHRRGKSSGAIEEIDFVEQMSMKARPGKRKHKMSIQDDDGFGKVWRNTMAPRPSAKEILVQSKHDEFILLFQQQLAEVKKEKLETFQRKQSHVRQLEKRNSVPDFAMLSEIDSENDITAHRQRLSTLREEQISNLTFTSSKTLESVDELNNNKLDSSKSSRNGFKNGSKQKLLDDDGNSVSKVSIDNGLMDEWDKNVSPQHGCCYYFCCCCLCGIFMNYNQSDIDDGMTYSPHDT